MHVSPDFICFYGKEQCRVLLKAVILQLQLKCSALTINTLWWLIEGILFLEPVVAQSDDALVQLAGKKECHFHENYLIEGFWVWFWVWFVCWLFFSPKIYKNLFHTYIWHWGFKYLFLKTSEYLYFQNLLLFFFFWWVGVFGFYMLL